MNTLEKMYEVADFLNYDFTATRDMSKTYLVGQDLSDLDLSKAILNQAELDCAILHDTDLSGTSLKETSFFSADLERADLSHAKVSDCDFRHANLEGAKLEGVNFSNSDVRDAIFTDATGLSLEQKLWLKEHGALNICFETHEKELINQKKNQNGLMEKVKSWLSFSH